jgi:hypothetical protein
VWGANHNREEDMNSINVLSVVGSYPIALAFSIARDLEHAGIRTDIKRADEREHDNYVVRVKQRDIARAITLV